MRSLADKRDMRTQYPNQIGEMHDRMIKLLIENIMVVTTSVSNKIYFDYTCEVCNGSSN